MKRIVHVLCLVSFFLVSFSLKAVSYYWAGGKGDWSQLNNWVTTNGGSVTHTSLPDSTDNVFMGVGDTICISQDTSWCNVLINTNGVLRQSGGYLFFFGDLANNGEISQTGGKFVISGLSLNTISGTQDIVLDSLVLNKNGYIDIARDVVIEGNMEFVQGYVFTYAASLIRFEPGATSNTGTFISYVIGPVEKRGSEYFEFPIGAGGKWARLTISDASVLTDTSTMRAEYFNPQYIDTANYNLPLKRVSYREYWTLDRVLGSGSFKVRLHFEDAIFQEFKILIVQPWLNILRVLGMTWQIAIDILHLEQDG